MASVHRWTTLQKAITSKLDEAEAAWKAAKEECAALKNSLPPNRAVGIDAAYAHLTASFDIVVRRNRIYVQFDQGPPPGTFSMEALLITSYCELQFTETTTGQLIRIFATAQDKIDTMEAQHAVFEQQVDAKLAQLREEIGTMAEDLRERGIGAAITALEGAEQLCEAVLHRLDGGGYDGETREMRDVVEDCLVAYARVAVGRGVVDRLHLVLMRELARLGFGMARQRVVTEFMEVERVVRVRASGVQRDGVSSSKPRREARQAEITEFFELHETIEVRSEPTQEKSVGSQIEG